MFSIILQFKQCIGCECQQWISMVSQRYYWWNALCLRANLHQWIHLVTELTEVYLHIFWQKVRIHNLSTNESSKQHMKYFTEIYLMPLLNAKNRMVSWLQLTHVTSLMKLGKNYCYKAPLVMTNFLLAYSTLNQMKRGDAPKNSKHF